MSSGWVCPICGRVFAPWVMECPYHGGKRDEVTCGGTTPLPDDYPSKYPNEYMAIKVGDPPNWNDSTTGAPLPKWATVSSCKTTEAGKTDAR